MRFLSSLWNWAKTLVRKGWHAQGTQHALAFLRQQGMALLKWLKGGFLEPYPRDPTRRFSRLRAWGGDVWKRFERNDDYFRIRISAALMVLAALLALFHPGPVMGLICAGMGFSFLGDAMLMEYPPIRSLVRQYFLWGMGFFAVAQALYTRALWLLYARGSGNLQWPLWLMIALFVIAGLVFMAWIVLFRHRQPLVLRIGATIYSVLVATMAGSAVAVCIATVGRGWPLLIGGPLFMISDLLIALRDFSGADMERGDTWIWLTYVPAQLLLIVGSAALA